ncbi:Septin-9 [Armadillidium nasatum]|uniref:Septin-9 n=1 Tax=Armadillidium nasatum TaxID=96803 RepID=A0A5N5TB50_9CRUS|nr:Septin-9 [Armadillidium nasatum]
MLETEKSTNRHVSHSSFFAFETNEAFETEMWALGMDFNFSTKAKHKKKLCRRNLKLRGRYSENFKIRSVCCDLYEKGVKLWLTVTDTPGFGDQLGASCGIYRKTVPLLLGRRKKTAKKIPTEGHKNPLLSLFHSTKLNSLDIEVMKRLCSIERKSFKERIRADLLDHDVEIYPLKEFEDEEDVADNHKIREMMPFAVIGSTLYHEVHGRKVLGRKTNWGLVEVENKNHCDFPILRDPPYKK